MAEAGGHAIKEIAEAAGCSKASASDIRRGDADAARIDVFGGCETVRARVGLSLSLRMSMNSHGEVEMISRYAWHFT